MNKHKFLQPCPFCGSADVFMNAYTAAYVCYVVCGDCSANGPVQPTEKEAIEEWNARD
jgi:Lar family restriction alleviation protein